MSTSIDKANKIFKKFDSQDQDVGQVYDTVTLAQPSKKSLPYDNSEESILSRIQTISTDITPLNAVLPSREDPDLTRLNGSIENFIGFAQVPIGVTGPLQVNGTDAQGEFYIPLATTEGALVASYHRGAKACSLAGGVTSICIDEGVQRSPLFCFDTIKEAIQFLDWMTDQKEICAEIAGQYTRHGRLQDIEFNMEGNNVILTFDYHTGDASGQNMVTICTEAICQYIAKHSPVAIKKWYVESNYSGDKKANALSFSSVRGKKVVAECVIPKDIVKSVLKTTPEALEAFWRVTTVAVMQTGSIGAQGHIANGLAALFLATGQDIACVSEASVGISRVELRDNGDLYASVTVPNLIVGTVGGGTKFSTAQECLAIMECQGAGKAKKYAEICAALLLCGELSIAAAIVEGHFTSAHKNLGRG